MKKEDREKYYKALKDEIINDPTNQGYNGIFKAKYDNIRDKYTKIAQKMNCNRAMALDFPIVRTNIVQFVLKDE